MSWLAASARRRRALWPMKVRLMAVIVAMLVAMMIARFAASGEAAAAPKVIFLFIVLVAVVMAIRVRMERTVAVDEALGGRHAHLRRERAILQAAMRNGGRVTPAQAALAGDDMAIAEAKEILDSLAKQGLCAVDSDDRGQVYYDFSLAVGQPGAELSGEAWVDAAAARMTDADEAASEEAQTML